MAYRRLRWLLWLSAILAGVIVSGFVAGRLIPPRVSLQHYHRIEVGVTTEAEVDALLGPEGTFFRGSPGPFWEHRTWMGPSTSSEVQGGGVFRAHSKNWDTDDGGIHLLINNEDNKVIVKTFYFSSVKTKWWYWTLIDWGVAPPEAMPWRRWASE